MKSFNKHATFLIIVLISFVTWSCESLFENHASQFHLDDINKVEWARPNPASSSLSYTAALEADQTDSETVTLEVQLIGEQVDYERSVFVGVVDDETDATEGEHFQINNDNNEVVIPANSNFGEVSIEIFADNMNNGDELSALLELQEGEELGVAVNMKDMDLTIEKDS